MTWPKAGVKGFSLTSQHSDLSVEKKPKQLVCDHQRKQSNTLEVFKRHIDVALWDMV